MPTRPPPALLDEIRLDLVFEIQMLHETESRIAARAAGRAGLPLGGDADEYLGAMDALRRCRRGLAAYCESLR
jgi:hypothetical protein